MLSCLLFREGGPTCRPISTLAAYVLGESYLGHRGYMIIISEEVGLAA